MSIFVILQPASVLGEVEVKSAEEQSGLGTSKADALKYLKAGSASAGYTEPPEDPRVIAARVVQIFLGIVGSIFVYLFVYSGYTLLSSQGEEDKISTARKTMTGAVVGLFIILLAFGITYFVGKAGQEITEVNGPQTPEKYTP